MYRSTTPRLRPPLPFSSLHSPFLHTIACGTIPPSHSWHMYARLVVLTTLPKKGCTVGALKTARMSGRYCRSGESPLFSIPGRDIMVSLGVSLLKISLLTCTAALASATMHLRKQNAFFEQLTIYHSTKTYKPPKSNHKTPNFQSSPLPSLHLIMPPLRPLRSPLHLLHHHYHLLFSTRPTSLKLTSSSPNSPTNQPAKQQKHLPM